MLTLLVVCLLQKPVVLQYEVKLFFAYEENEATADEKFLNKKVEFLMRGKVEKNKDGTYFVGSEIVSPAPEGMGYGIVCNFAPSERARLAKAKPGQAFQIRGVCKGSKPSVTAWKGRRITLDDCELVSLMDYDSRLERFVPAK